MSLANGLRGEVEHSDQGSEDVAAGEQTDQLGVLCVAAYRTGGVLITETRHAPGPIATARLCPLTARGLLPGNR